MTVIADSKKRITLKLAKPGQSFDVQAVGDGKFIVTRLEPVKPNKVRLVKKDGYTVGVTTRPITQEQVRAALDEFP